MTDLERFFRHLARTVAATDPSRLRRPIPLAELHQSIVPYRRHRRALGLASSEDYEMVLLRLCAGEDGLARVEPEEAGERFAREVASPHPELDVLHQQGEVTLTLARDAVARALAAEPAREPDSLREPEPTPGPEPAVEPESPADPPAPSFTQPEAELLPGSAEPAFEPVHFDPPEPRPEAEARAEPRAAPDAASSCAFCGGALPSGRQVNFCPHCGQNPAAPRCVECGADLESGWRHCVNCGARLPSR